MTTRGLGEKEFVQIADLIHEGVQISLKAKKFGVRNETPRLLEVCIVS